MIDRFIADFAPRRAVAAIVAIAMMLAAMPVIAEGVASRSGTTLSISLDICHPLQGLDHAAEPAPIARPRPAGTVPPFEFGMPLVLAAKQYRSDYYPTPDAPPPKSIES